MSTGVPRSGTKWRHLNLHPEVHSCPRANRRSRRLSKSLLPKTSPCGVILATHMNEVSTIKTPIRFPWLLWLATIVGLIGINGLTQPYEDQLSLVAPTIAYYLDVIWYLDDIIGPSFFFIAGVLLLRQTGFKFNQWPVMGLGMACVFFCFGDTMDIHWVLPSGIERESHAVSFSSWMSKVMVVITFCFFMVQSYDQFPRAAQKNMMFAFLLLYIDQIQMSISFDFAGYYFHVFEESLEVITAMVLAFGVGRLRINP